MNPTGKLSKRALNKRLHEDDLQVFLSTIQSQTSDLWNQHGKSVSLGIIIVVSVLAIWGLFRMNQVSNLAEQQTLLASALSKISEVQQNASSGSFSTEGLAAANADLDTLIQNHGSSNAATAARVLRGYCAIQTGDGQTAVRMFQEAINKTSDPALQALFRIALARAQATATEDPSTAISELTELREQLSESNTMHQFATYLLGQLEEATGNDSKALELYKSLPADSTWRIMADRNIQWLEAQPLPPLQAKP